VKFREQEILFKQSSLCAVPFIELHRAGRPGDSPQSRFTSLTAKARGVVLGRYGREVLSKQNRAKAVELARQLAPVLTELRSHLTFEQMARVMNERGIPTVRGKRWHAATVHRLFRRAAAIQRAS
jgi:hypothetical protein